MAHVATAAHSGFHPIAWVRNVLMTVQAALHRRSVYNSVYAELSQLNDRELDDLGLSRSDFHRIAADAADKL